MPRSLWAVAALMVCAGFVLEQVALAPSGGSSTVSARPGVVTAVSTDTAAARGATPADTAAATGGPAGAAGPPPPAVPTPGGVRGRVPAPAGAPAGGATSAPAAPAGGATPALGGAFAGNPFAGATLFVDPNGDAAAAVRALRASDPAGAATLARLAEHPHADWITDPDPAAARARVSARVGASRAVGALPVLVAYAIPQRDCGGGQSAGGVGGAAAYRAWIAAFAAGLGGRATVILEPDALAQIDCLAPAAAAARYAMLGDAVDQLTAAGAQVYIDAGNATWHPAADMAARLRQAGVARARGFALNVSNFDETADETAYGDAIVAALGGGAHFVVDTSRNGRGPAPDNAWCNPSGRGLGPAPTGATGDPRADAFLWIKVPGESDGACNGGPPAGQWWLDYALGLASRAT
ncbi:glycoside hydrolase family 6 protein [Frankia canadensis]|uniref:glycoside hydrolase family 6 protein n=1 Tax=Frankia canadensis TaxID=1836972 RepID=UPI001FAE8DB8|nr:glycoside hydrolase family 6 protein [Frankia canadensis]